MSNNKTSHAAWAAPLIILVVLNLIAQFVFEHQGSIFFGGKWWSTWFPVYLVLFSFLIIEVNKNDEK